MSEIKIIHADALEYTQTLSNNSVDLILTDPPYNTTKQVWDQKESITPELVSELYRVLDIHGSLYMWCGIGEKSQSLIRWFPLLSELFTFKDLITWKKRRGIGGRRGWLYTREEILWFVKSNKDFRWNRDYQYSTEPNQFTKGMSGTKVYPFKRLTNVWTDIPEVLVRRDGVKHYTPKPLDALTRIILAHTVEGDLVYDPFMGSGSTLVACKNLSRNGIGVDNDKFAIIDAEIRLKGAQ